MKRPSIHLRFELGRELATSGEECEVLDNGADLPAVPFGKL